MANRIIDDTILSDIADEINNKTGTIKKYKDIELAPAISQITTQSEEISLYFLGWNATTIPITITFPDGSIYNGEPLVDRLIFKIKKNSNVEIKSDFQHCFLYDKDGEKIQGQSTLAGPAGGDITTQIFNLTKDAVIVDNSNLKISNKL